ncbi:MAG: hypothetical protein M1564_00420 [Candidatus Marsarchaeota archaeon]|jgi:hypothetical protein|nr:hypothetical protein [Candidatus Marsarchaeota archaeon]MCL5430752.1 hypothetical protein [Candidatus Marsarchaeota archaeon]
MDTDWAVNNGPSSQESQGKAGNRRPDVETYLENEERYLGLDPEREKARRKMGKKLEGVHVIGDFLESFKVIAFKSDLIDSDIDSGRLGGFYISVMAVITLLMIPVFIFYGNSAYFRSYMMPSSFIIGIMPKALTSGLAGTVFLFLLEHFIIVPLILIAVAELCNWVGKMFLGFSGEYSNSFAAIIFGYLPWVYISVIESVLPLFGLGTHVSALVGGVLALLGVAWSISLAVFTESKQQGVGYAMSFLSLILAVALFLVILYYLVPI